MGKRVITFDIDKKIRVLALTDTIPEMSKELKINYRTIQKFCEKNNIKTLKSKEKNNKQVNTRYDYTKYKRVVELINAAPNDKKLFMGLMRQISTLKNEHYEQKAFNLLVEKAQKTAKQTIL
jgi:ribosomal protein S10